MSRPLFWAALRTVLAVPAFVLSAPGAVLAVLPAPGTVLPALLHVFLPVLFPSHGSDSSGSLLPAFLLLLDQLQSH